jgi:HAD superfamily hydrolase (TIGR01509 family)
MISFVYFDLGGVVEKDFSASNKWDQLMEELQIDVAYKDVFTDFWRDGERANCTTRDVDTLLPLMREKFGAKIPHNYSLLEGFVKRFEKNESIWPVLETIHKTTPIGLLTNQYVRMFEETKKRDILPPNREWNIIIDSTEVGLIKPDKEIYILAQEKAGVPNNEILFIDNHQFNLDPAKKLGWQTYLYDSAYYEDSSKDLAAFWSSVSH